MRTTQVRYVYDSTSYYRARYYDPTVGRFISEDPLGFNGDGANFYSYVENDPADLVDPAGTSDACTFGGADAQGDPLRHPSRSQARSRHKRKTGQQAGAE